MKFKPGISFNFQSRYVQISSRAFRYFRNYMDALGSKPIVCFRKSLIDRAVPYSVSKVSYLKPGTEIAKSRKEEPLFDNAFEITLKEDYEDNYRQRDLERAVRLA